jgi:hypothetical protein
MTASIKAGLIIAASAVFLRTPLIAAGPTSADYQAAIREATERYRGDCTETTVRERFYRYGSFTRDLADKYLRAFDDYPFTRSLLHALTPNPAIQLTPSRTAFTFDHD